MKYEDLYSRLCNNAMIVVFLKKNAELRVMLCTRDLMKATVSTQKPGMLLQAHDRICNMSNGNIAVIDLELGEPRSFNIERVVVAQETDVSTQEAWEKSLRDLYNVREHYKEKYQKVTGNINGIFNAQSNANESSGIGNQVQ